MGLELVLKSLGDNFLASETKFSDALDVQKNAIKRTARNENLDRVIELVKDASIMFSGTYLSVKESIQEENVFLGNNAELFTKIYSGFVAGQGTIQYLSTHENIERKDFENIKELNTNYNSSTDLIIKNTITKLSNEVSNSRTNSIGSKTMNFFANIGAESERRMNHKEFQTFVQKAKKITITSDYFSINGLELIEVERIKKKVREKEEHKSEWIKDPKKITLSNYITREEIQGNDDAIENLEWLTTQLFGFDFSTKTNGEIEEGFQRGALIYGLSGTGKSLVGQYILSEFEKTAKKFNLPYEMLVLDPETEWQDGQVINLRHQFNIISKPDKLRIVLIEEMEKTFSSRSGGTKETTKAKVGEFLDLWNQTSYPYHGNYLIIGLTNLPGDIDNAARRRLKLTTYECKGPETAEQKSAVIQHNLAKEIKSNYIQVKNWEDIGQLAAELNLSGSDLLTVADKAKSYINQKKRPKNYAGMSPEEKQKARYQYKKPINSDVIKTVMYEVGNIDKKIADAHKNFIDRG